MSAITVTPSAVALTYEPGEAQPDLAGGALYSMINRLLTQHGYPLWADMEVDMFGGDAGSLMLIARPAPEPDLCVSFSCFEDLINAVRACPRDLPSSLVLIEGAYLLFVAGGDSCPALSEFGRALSCSGRLRTHAGEHGKVLIERRAMALIRRCFCER